MTHPAAASSHRLGDTCAAEEGNKILPSASEAEAGPLLDYSRVEGAGVFCIDVPPFLQNLAQGRLNRDQWTGRVACAVIQEIDAREYKEKNWFIDDRACADGKAAKALVDQANMQDYQLCGEDHQPLVYVRRWQVPYEPISEVMLSEHSASKVRRSIEYRATMTGLAVFDPLLHHAFLLLELDDGYGICFEKYNNQLEIIFGAWTAVERFAVAWRAEGGARKASTAQPSRTYPTTSTLTVAWLLGIVGLYRWQPYDLIHENCQDHARDVLAQMNNPFAAPLVKPVNRNVCLAAVKANGRVLQHVPDKFKDDAEIVSAAVAQNGHALQYASPVLRNDEQIVLTAVENRGTAIYYASDRLKCSLRVKLAAVRQCPLLEGLGVDELRASSALVLRDVKRGHSSAMKSALSSLRDMSQKTVLDAVSANASALMYLPAEFQLNAEVVAMCYIVSRCSFAYAPQMVRHKLLEKTDVWLRAGAIMGRMRSPAAILDEYRRIQGVLTPYLDYVPKEMRSPEVCAEAVKQNGTALEHVPEALRSPGLCAEAVKKNGLALTYVPEALRSPELCAEAVKNDGRALTYVPEALASPGLCAEAVKMSWENLEFVPEALRSPGLCAEAVNESWIALKHVPEALRSPELCAEAVNESWIALEHVPEALRSPELCAEAVKKNGLALTYVPEALRSPELCAQAVKKPGRDWWYMMHNAPEVLKYVPEALRSPELCAEAVKLNGLALKHVPEALMSPELCAEALRRAPGHGALPEVLEYVPEALRTEAVKQSRRA